MEGASGYTFLFTTAQRKGQEKEGREARPASSRPLLFPRTQSGEAQGTAGAGEQHGSGKESRAMERDPPLTTNLGRNGKIEETGGGCGGHSQTSEISTQSTSPHVYLDPTEVPQDKLPQDPGTEGICSLNQSPENPGPNLAPSPPELGMETRGRHA